MKGTGKPRLVFTTDVNGTTTPDNTFAELVRPDGLGEEMEGLMKSYTTGERSFAEVLPDMRRLASGVDRERLRRYALRMPLFPGVRRTLDAIVLSENVDSKAALSTTGFAGLIALVVKYRHTPPLNAAASDVLAGRLTPDEKRCLVETIASERDKTRVLDRLAAEHDPTPGLVFHAGDTLGDLPGIVHAARKGGVGIAFRPNEPLRVEVARLDRSLRKHIALVAPDRDTGPDYNRVLHIVRETVLEKTRTFL